MNSHDFSAFERLYNMRRHGSRFNKVIAIRALHLPLTPYQALRWAREIIRKVKANPKLKHLLNGRRLSYEPRRYPPNSKRGGHDQLNCIVAAIRARSIQPPKGGD